MGRTRQQRRHMVTLSPVLSQAYDLVKAYYNTTDASAVFNVCLHTTAVMIANKLKEELNAREPTGTGSLGTGELENESGTANAAVTDGSEESQQG